MGEARGSGTGAQRCDRMEEMSHSGVFFTRTARVQLYREPYYYLLARPLY